MPQAIDQQAKGSNTLTLLGDFPTISSSFWIIFWQALQWIRFFVISRSPCQERKPLEVVSQTPQGPWEGLQEGAFGRFHGRQDRL